MSRAGALPPAGPGYVIRTAVQRVVVAWKVLTGYDKFDRKWDKAHFGRTARTAKELLEFLDGDSERALACCEDILGEMTRRGLNCTIETVLKHSAAWKIKNGDHNRSDSTGV